ncbi:MAG: hypothetical protein ACPG4T_19110 [Nannocystaceae bacterium]
MTSGGHNGWQGPSLRAVVIAIVVLAVGLGVLANWRYTQSENQIRQALSTFDQSGGSMDVEQCIDAVITWHDDTCDANLVLCDHAIPMAMVHCLEGQDRKQYCDGLDRTGSFIDDEGNEVSHDVASGQWVYYSCLRRGSECKKRKKCPCADAYRAIDSFCRSEQRGVHL